ncbi:MAG TPA: hypothetical protein VFE50_11625 [Cyclobacteriaceae bacterium]|nr:hypothetical protein [Cyclobacteriaceae bacterium]
MDERLSLKAVEDYSEDFASKVTASFFSKKDKITGPEILKLSTVHQVNLFVIRELLRAWQHEGQKLRSPYFDYTAPEVKEEMERFQNVLSNHILISKENFQPLLKKAVNQTLFLIIDPYDFFSDTLDKQGSSHVRLADLRNEIRYLKINKPPLERLAQKMEDKKLDLIAGKEAFGMLDQILEEVNFTPEDIDGYVSEFSKVVPLKVESLYEKKVVAVQPPPIAVKKVEEVKESKEIREVKHTVVDNFKKISSIKDSLTINQKFMFTKMLFKGDFEIFSQAVDKLDRLDNIKQAMRYFDENYPEWDKESEEYEEFIELVEKRFA